MGLRVSSPPDRLLAARSWLALSDDGVGQILTGNLGNLTINLAGECTMNAQLTAEKFLTNHTAPGASFTTAYLQTNVSETGGPFVSDTFKGLHIDMDVNYNNAASAFFDTVHAIDIDMDLTDTASLGGLFSANILTANLNYPSTYMAQGSPINVQIASANASSTFGTAAILFNTTLTNSTGKNVCCRTEAVSTGAGSNPIGYEGYGSHYNSGTGTVIGVHGLAVMGSATSVLIGVQGDILIPGSTPADRRTSVHGTSGHMICSMGSLWVTSANATYAGAISTTHMTPTSLAGAGYFKGLLEVDGVTWMDGGGKVGADPGGTANFLGLTNVFPALGGGAAATLGTIGGSGPTAAAQAGWIKMYNGTTTIFVPYWT